MAVKGKSVPAVRGESRDLVEPIVVPNTLWQSPNPLAYEGGRPAEITHLAEVAATEAARRDDAR